MNGWMTAGIVVLFLIVALIWRIRYETHTFVVRHEQIRINKCSEKGSEKRIVVLSDLHDHEYGTDNEALVEAIRAQNPDLILIAGDMLVERSCDQHGRGGAQAKRFVKRLPGIAPVYYANGNHEQRMKALTKPASDRYVMYREELEEAGVRFLENDSCRVKFEDGMRCIVSGLELPMACYSHQLFADHKSCLREADIKERLGEKADDSLYHILLAHHPVYADVYWDWGADLVLSGHLHGGIVRIPGICGAISPQMDILPKYSGGLYEKNGRHICVSRGLGTHTINLRLFNRAEVVVLHLQPDPEVHI